MKPHEVAAIIEAALGGSQAMVTSDDNVHFEAIVIAPAFVGKKPIQRHQMVYSTLGAAVGNEIHALALQVFTPDEYARQGRG
ncbi:MAG TPA: BolA/IbaG family iron-sulfur metabolism protein [Steroidobacteraceae bacterium]|jgi:acid stress-induced BolA-like protein IbaG/YrbA|nr:BolA/IbaG family iron-sulfur metabolism protein [Steroidobacteraceae bacterium]